MTAEHVRPALVVPTPVVRTDLGLSLAAKRRNWLLPHPGSPVFGGSARETWKGPGGGTDAWCTASVYVTDTNRRNVVMISTIAAAAAVDVAADVKTDGPMPIDGCQSADSDLTNTD